MWFAVDYSIEHFQYLIRLGLGLDLGLLYKYSVVFPWWEFL